MKKNLLILGAGQYGKVLREIAEAQQLYEKICFLDDKCTGEVIGCLTDYSLFSKATPHRK